MGQRRRGRESSTRDVPCRHFNRAPPTRRTAPSYAIAGGRMSQPVDAPHRLRGGGGCVSPPPPQSHADGPRAGGDSLRATWAGQRPTLRAEGAGAACRARVTQRGAAPRGGGARAPFASQRRRGLANARRPQIQPRAGGPALGTAEAPGRPAAAATSRQTVNAPQRSLPGAAPAGEPRRLSCARGRGSRTPSCPPPRAPAT
jgi:hypothetical protein